VQGPYRLTRRTIDGYISRVSPGVYLLYDSRTGSAEYVGRSDTDLNARLKNWVNQGYQYFRFTYCRSPEAAFYKECRLYHHFIEHKDIDNVRHPRRPDYTDWSCPDCYIFD
jgi:hypothetical protein